MDFDLNEEQSILKDTVERFLADAYPFGSHGAATRDDRARRWSALAEMGLLAIPFAEDDGGIGGGAVETMIVMEAIGKSLALEPYLANIVLGGGFIRLGGDADLRAELVPGVVDGSLRLAFAQVERNGRYDLHHVETTARRSGEAYVLNGAKGVVLGGDEADHLFVTARVGGGARDEGGIGLFIVDAKAQGVSRQPYALHDGHRAAEVAFANAPARAVGDPEGGLALVRQVADAAIAAICAESVGVMTAMLDLTTGYMKERKQFGRVIGDFQALQHEAVDMYVALQQARSITLYATMMAESMDVEERKRAMHAAKAQIGRSGRIVAENAVQLHGGIGVTEEYAVGHYFRRQAMIDLTLGDQSYHLSALARAGSLFADEF